jgi:hypothetical protein
MMRRKAVWGGFATVALMVLLARPASAQVSVTGYAGTTETKVSDYMVMGDLQAGKVLVEPWAEMTGLGPLAYGAELLVTTSEKFGFIGGVDNGVGEHYGVFFNLTPTAQLRTMRHSRGAFEEVLLSNFYLTESKKLYLQGWVVMTSDKQSRAMLGIGYTLKP